jgi:putative pyruvate formate lyase activating enzyme
VIPVQEIKRRAAEAFELLGERCVVCPRGCKVDRRADVAGLCAIGRHAVVASYFPHFGEEDCLRGARGSGTLFFSGCNLRCVFCLAPGSLVTTEHGPKPIDEIFSEGTDELVVGDGRVRRPSGIRVHTITGELAPVTKAFAHHYSGDLIRLNTDQSAPDIRLTPNHEVFAAHGHGPDDVVKVPAGELTPDDYLVVPRLGARVPALVGGGGGHEPGRHFLDRLVQVEREHYEGPVYNLEVDHPSHSYLAPAVAVGNCQNHDISWEVRGEVVTPARLAAMMLELQAIGCHNINWVTPEHVVPQILEALPIAVDRGLRLPIVYNTSAYDSVDSLRLMDGLVDVYMPDFKVWTSERARTYLGKREYADVARANIKEMHRQVGDLVLDGRGLAVRGLIVRHLVMPGQLDETERILRFVEEELGPDTYVNLMGQYYPAGKVGKNGKYADIARRLDRSELEQAFELGDSLGLRLDPRSRHQSVGV